MPSYQTGTVTGIIEERRGLQRVETSIGPAYVLTGLVGTVEIGDEVVMNTTAVDRALGTGGWHVVHWNLARTEWSERGPGHIMKLRYTSLQVDTGAGEEDFADAPDDLDGTPVVVCSLHSQVACVAAALHEVRPGTRLAYVMTDGAALPLVLSDLVAAMTDRGLLVGTVTAGNAFGGDVEAVNVPSALSLARVALGADAIVVGMGPGVVGTGTSLGTTAIEAAAICDAAAALGGDPILTVRASSADPRQRHRDQSHHTLTALRLVRSPVTVAIPRSGFEGAAPDARYELVDVPDMGPLLERVALTVTTMGRGPAEDPLFFAAAGAAGVVAARRLAGAVP